MKTNLKSNLSRTGAAFLVFAVAGCGSSHPSHQVPPEQQNRCLPHAFGDCAPATPTILSSAPADGAVGVPVNTSVSVVFSESMDPATVNANTFTVTSAPFAIPVPGSISYSIANSRVEFWPAALLATNSTFTATVTTGATSKQGIALDVQRVWIFHTGAGMAPGVPVDLGTSGNFVILSKAGISTVPASAVTGDIGVSPAAATYITGFSLIMDASNQFSTSSQVVGQVFAADYTAPSPTRMTTAVSDMETAFTAAAARAPDVTELGAGDIGGMTLVAGVYKWGSGLLIPTDVTLHGSATDVWIFQISQDLTVANGKNIYLSGGALPKNIFWQVAGAVNIGTTAHFEGNILTYTAATMETGSSINGRLLAQTAVTIDGSTVVQPAP